MDGTKRLGAHSDEDGLRCESTILYNPVPGMHLSCEWIQAQGSRV